MYYSSIMVKKYPFREHLVLMILYEELKEIIDSFETNGNLKKEAILDLLKKAKYAENQEKDWILDEYHKSLSTVEASYYAIQAVPKKVLMKNKNINNFYQLLIDDLSNKDIIQFKKITKNFLINLLEVIKIEKKLVEDSF